MTGTYLGYFLQKVSAAMTLIISEINLTKYNGGVVFINRSIQGRKYGDRVGL